MTAHRASRGRPHSLSGRPYRARFHNWRSPFPALLPLPGSAFFQAPEYQKRVDGKLSIRGVFIGKPLASCSLAHMTGRPRSATAISILRREAVMGISFLVSINVARYLQTLWITVVSAN